MSLNDWLAAHEGTTDLAILLAVVLAWSAAMLTGIFVRGLL